MKVLGILIWAAAALCGASGFSLLGDGDIGPGILGLCFAALLGFLGFRITKRKQKKKVNAVKPAKQPSANQRATPAAPVTPAAPASAAAPTPPAIPTAKEQTSSPKTLPMERDSCQRKYQYDVAVAGSTYYDVSAAIPGEFVALEFEPLNQYDSNAIAVVQNGHKLGHIPRGNIQQMIHDFNSRNEPVLALLSTINGSELTLSIGFYKSRLSELMNSGAKRKTFKLTGNRNADMQENLSFCSVGESVDACYDAEKGKYLASAGCDIGYFPASADDLLEGDFEAVIEELEENDDGKYSVSVTVYEA